MNTLTTAIAVPQITNLRVVRVSPDLDDTAIYIIVQARSTAGLVYKVLTITIRNGTSDGIRATTTPLGFLDRIETFSASTPTGFTTVLAANVGAGLVVRNKAVETELISLGLLPAGVVT